MIKRFLFRILWLCFCLIVIIPAMLFIFFASGWEGTWKDILQDCKASYDIMLSTFKEGKL